MGASSIGKKKISKKNSAIKSQDACAVVLVTAKDLVQAKSIAHALVSSRLAACVNCVPGITSVFLWQGNIEEEQEVLMVIKTRQSLFAKLCAKVKALHSYTTPEIIALPMVAVENDYLQWIKESV